MGSLCRGKEEQCELEVLRLQKEMFYYNAFTFQRRIAHRKGGGIPDFVRESICLTLNKIKTNLVFLDVQE